MKSIFNFLIRGLGDLLSGFGKTKSTSTVGLIGSTGSGKSIQKAENKNGINWTIIILFILVFVGGYLIPSPFTSSPRQNWQATSHSEVLSPGMVDTVYVRLPAIVGRDTEVDIVTYVAELDLITIKAMPAYIENTVNINSGGIIGSIRATAYPYIENDTLKIELPIEWNLNPKPMEQISRVDTLRIIDSIFTVKDISLLEKPEVVAIGTSIVWLAILIVLL